MKWLKAKPQDRIEHKIPERPLLHACSGQDRLFGDATVDIDPNMKPDVVADITKRIPYPDNSFAAAFADFPWTAAFKSKVASAMKELCCAWHPSSTRSALGHTAAPSVSSQRFTWHGSLELIRPSCSASTSAKTEGKRSEGV